jgi:hypothetical protein
VFKAFDWNEQSAATTGQGIMRLLVCYEEIPKEKQTPFSRQTSVLNSYESSSGFVIETCGVGRWTLSDDARTVQDEMYSDYVVTFNTLHVFCEIYRYLFLVEIV